MGSPKLGHIAQQPWMCAPHSVPFQTTRSGHISWDNQNISSVGGTRFKVRRPPRSLPNITETHPIWVKKIFPSGPHAVDWSPSPFPELQMQPGHDLLVCCHLVLVRKSYTKNRWINMKRDILSFRGVLCQFYTYRSLYYSWYGLLKQEYATCCIIGHVEYSPWEACCHKVKIKISLHLLHLV